MLRALLPFLALGLLSVGASGCVTTYAQHGMYMMQDNCMGCEGGDTIVNPAVVEYVLSRPESKIAEHYKMVVGWRTGKLKVTEDGAFNGPLRQNMIADLEWVLAEQQDFIAGEVAKRGGTAGDLATMAPQLEDGELLARALARLTAPGAAAAFADVQRAQWLWAQRWEQDDEGTWDTPMVFGGYNTLIIGKTAERTVELFNSGKGLDATVPMAVFDVSEVEGAFDAGAALSFDEVAAKIKPKAK
jgi:hypothetical protein